MSEILTKIVSGLDGQKIVPLDNAEIAQREKDLAEDLINQKAKTAAATKAASDKAALLAKLGITADEAKLLLS